ncbi:type II toxin-antitoxin system HicB family antitoxin [Paenibacillus piri]|uniref:Type II toxin-antitoxin system HicB family antitoxin n=1 Tax=Paenibacillus piri TaxID=2547395 RepID=A0A4R5KRM7_9BACL|nr:type II toxin-antitoxin system HicB family antitoxin [Paenibacillus piri]TDF98276.1 type II toxin-antitoxin system HicB family antitoxin [Paenibacillus piri]
MAKYIYPAVFDPNENGGFTVTFPDLPGCITEGDDMDDALRMASEALALHLYGMERDGDLIPSPSKPADIQFTEDADANAFVSLVQARTEPIRDELQNRAVKKTLTIPQWLNEEAESAGINFSQLLQYALKEKLGIIEKRP